MDDADHRGQPGQQPPDQPKSYETILDQQVELALHELNRPSRGLFASGLSAGLDIGFSAFAVALVTTLMAGMSEPLVAFARANAYTVGFVFVIFGRSELFTEHTTLAALPVLRRRANIAQLARLWGLVYVANIVGTLAFAAMLAVVGPALGAVSTEALAEVGRHLIDHETWVILASAMLAGWMMGLLSWLVTAGRETISEIFFVWLVTMLIGLGGLHHSIVGSAEIAAAWFGTASVGASDYLRVISLTTVGNAIGGVLFVAVVKYAHATVTEHHLRRRVNR